MKKRILVVCSVSLLTAFTSFGQTQAATKHPISQTVSAIPVLKLQAEKIQAKETQLSQAATSSRAHYAQISEELNALNKEYVVLLNKEIALCTQESARRELEAELHYVELQLEPTTNQQ